ncbi:hypothetical protein JB92DRAFT_2142588 [Gautieria morchelliformis]|nr:hypothetical protein JB92DRAFT_2142588 [Gautieria morchelliformis]
MAEHHNSTGQPRPFTFLHRSPGMSPETDEDNLLRTRRHHSQNSARVLDLKHGKQDRNHLAGSSEQSHTHASGLPSSFVRQEAEVVPAQSFQYSESRSSRASDIAVPAKQVVVSGHQPFFLAHGYQNLATHRKTLHERLQPGDQSQHSQFTDALSYSNPSRPYQPSSVQAHELATSPFPSRVVKNTCSVSPVHGMAVSESQASASNFKNEDTVVNTRSRSNSVVGSSADTKGMQGVVMEAMKSIQRYESENESQKSEIDRLNTRVALLENEKNQLANKVQLIKNTSLKKLATSSQRYVASDMQPFQNDVRPL